MRKLLYILLAAAATIFVAAGCAKDTPGGETVEVSFNLPFAGALSSKAVGDGSTVVFIQDLLVAPARQRQGVGTALVKALLARYPRVRQIQLTADDTPKTAAFYQSLGFAPLKKAGCIGYIKTGK